MKTINKIWHRLSSQINLARDSLIEEARDAYQQAAGAFSAQRVSLEKLRRDAELLHFDLNLNKEIIHAVMDGGSEEEKGDLTRIMRNFLDRSQHITRTSTAVGGGCPRFDELVQQLGEFDRLSVLLKRRGARQPRGFDASAEFLRSLALEMLK